MTRAARTLATLLTALCLCAAAGARPQDAPALSPAAIRVASLTYADNQGSACFSDLFLRLAAYETGAEIDPALRTAAIASPELFEFPFAVITGEGAFELNDDELAALRAWLCAGGFLIASPGCSSAAWSASMERAIARLFPDPNDDAGLEDLPIEHEIFTALYEIPGLSTADAKPARVLGLTLRGRLAVVYSPSGLNDSETAGQGCCCCGTGEIRQARFLNANLLVYALLQ